MYPHPKQNQQGHRCSDRGMNTPGTRGAPGVPREPAQRDSREGKWQDKAKAQFFHTELELTAGSQR